MKIPFDRKEPLLARAAGHIVNVLQDLPSDPEFAKEYAEHYAVDTVSLMKEMMNRINELEAQNVRTNEVA